MISGIPTTTDPWVLYRWFVNELRMQGFNEDLISTVLAKPPYVPRETCSNCGFPSYPGRMVKLTPDYKCVECGRGDIFEVVPPPKVKHKEVFENVKWDENSKTNWKFPYICNVDVSFEKFLQKGTKVTIEWEE